MENGVNNNESRNKLTILLIIAIVLSIGAIALSSYAFFSYSHTGGNNTISTGKIKLKFTDSENNINIVNQFPISDNEAISMVSTDNEVVITDFTVTGYSTMNTPLKYKVSAVKGDDITNYNRMVDEHVKLYLVAEDNNKGSITIKNGYDIANTEDNIYGALASAGNNGTNVKDGGEIELAIGQLASDETTHNYTLRMWISDNVKISDTTTTYQYCASESECNDNRLVYKTMYYSLKIKVESLLD